MALIFFIICNSDSQNPSFVFSRLCILSAETLCVILLLNLSDSFLRRMPNLQFQNNAVGFFVHNRIKNKIHISLTGFVFTFYPIFVTGSKIAFSSISENFSISSWLGMLTSPFS